jgi:hypothetical protein
MRIAVHKYEPGQLRIVGRSKEEANRTSRTRAAYLGSDVCFRISCHSSSSLVESKGRSALSNRQKVHQRRIPSSKESMEVGRTARLVRNRIPLPSRSDEDGVDLAACSEHGGEVGEVAEEEEDLVGDTVLLCVMASEGESGLGGFEGDDWEGEDRKERLSW